MLVETPLGTAEVTREGQGPPLVLVHSLLTDAHAYDPVAPALAANNTVVRVSLPGFGSSPALRPTLTSSAGDPMSVADLADFVLEAMDATAVEPGAVVVGNGLGGFVVVVLALRHSARIGGLVAANCGATFPPERQGAFETMARLVEDQGMAGVIDIAVQRIFTPAYLDAHPHANAERGATLRSIDPHAFAAAARALAVLDLRPQLAAITMPTLVVAGADDQTTPPFMATELADGIGGATLREIADCGHCPPLEQPDAFLAAVEPFLARRAQAATG
jgi:pimeloyl-ACP methyl ester carboxylesterase